MPLADNYPEDTFRYELHVYGVQTPFRYTIERLLRISESEGETGTRRMADGLRKVHLSPSVYVCSAIRR